jgi:hypothetical protein
VAGIVCIQSGSFCSALAWAGSKSATTTTTTTTWYGMVWSRVEYDVVALVRSVKARVPGVRSNVA